jgi:hypothetical protein
VTAPRSITARGRLALASSALLCVAAWFVASRWRPFTLPPEQGLAALASERAALRDSENTVRDGLRAQVAATRPAGWSEAALAGWPAEVGNDWRVEWQVGPEARATVAHVAPHLADWAACLAFIERWSVTPGVALESLDLRAEGGRHDRRFVHVEVGLRFQREVAPAGDAERPGPSPGPLPVAPAAGPAASRKVGPVPSLHHPAASAEPPARGAGSASFRPDPPGLWAGSTTNPQPKSP